MKINTSGVLGVLAILTMFVIGFLKHWSISWLYFVLAIVICSVALIYFSSTNDKVNALAWNLAWLALAAGLLIDMESWMISLFLLVVGIALGYAMSGILVLLEFNGISHILGLGGLLLMTVSAITQGMGLSGLYAGVALVLYSISIGGAAMIADHRIENRQARHRQLAESLEELKSELPAYYDRRQSLDALASLKLWRAQERVRERRELEELEQPYKVFDDSELLLVWGTHLALILASIGLFVGVERFVPPSTFTYFKDHSAIAYQAILYAGLLAASVFGGLAIPHLLFREK